MAGGPKLVHLTFNMDEGPKVKIREIDFVGNKASATATLRGAMKDNKAPGRLAVASSPARRQHLSGDQVRRRRGEDRCRLLPRPRLHPANVGAPEHLKSLGRLEGQKTRSASCGFPSPKAQRYKVGEFDFAGNTVVKTRGAPAAVQAERRASTTARSCARGSRRRARSTAAATGVQGYRPSPEIRRRQRPRSLDRPAARTAARIVDVTMRMQEGKQFFVNRITFVGNTTTRDNVIRREMRLVEDGVFNTEALKYSVSRSTSSATSSRSRAARTSRRADEAPARASVDVKLKLEEQNRNQLTFGAGVSQFEGFFGQLVVPDGELPRPRREPQLSRCRPARARRTTARVHRAVPVRPEHHRRRRHLQAGSRTRSIHERRPFTQKRPAAASCCGFPVAPASRGCSPTTATSASGHRDHRTRWSPTRRARGATRSSIRCSSARAAARSSARSRRASSTTRSTSRSSRPAAKFTASIDLGRPRRQHQLLQADGRGRLVPARRTADVRSACAATADTSRPIGDTQLAADLREAVPRRRVRSPRLRHPHDRPAAIRPRAWCSAATRACCSTSRTDSTSPARCASCSSTTPARCARRASALQGASSRLTSAGPDAGDPDHRRSVREHVGPWRLNRLFPELIPERVKIGETSAFKTSTGAEIRFFMPVLNVPFRLIFDEPERGGVLDNTCCPQKA